MTVALENPLQLRSEPLAGSLRVVANTRADGSTALETLASDGLIAARPTAQGLWLVGAGSNPIGGDQIRIDLALDDGATLVIRSTGASVARRGMHSARSATSVCAQLGEGATLCWLPEPTVTTEGSAHEAATILDLKATSRLVWREEVVLGRVGEVPGTWTGSMRIERLAVPCLAASVALGPGASGWPSSALIGDARAFVSLTVVDPGRISDLTAQSWRERDGARATTLRVDSAVSQVCAWGPTLRACRALAGEAVSELGPFDWFPPQVFEQ